MNVSLLSRTVDTAPHPLERLWIVEDVRGRLSDRGLVMVAILAVLALAASLARALEHVWHPSLALHALLAATLIVVACLGRRLNFRIRAYALLGMLLAVAFAELLVFGLAGTGLMMLAGFSVVTALAMGIRAGLGALLSALCVIALSGTAIVSGMLPSGFDLVGYADSWSAWAVAFVLFAVVVFLIIVGIAGAQGTLQRSIRELREHEAALRAFMDNAPQPLSLKDRQGRYLTANAEFLRMVGLPRDQVLGRTDQELGVWNDACLVGAISSHEQKVLESGAAVALERSVRASNGVERIWNIIKFPVVGEVGEVVALGTVNVDVTEQHATERALRESEEGYRNLIQGSVQGIAIHREWRPVFANRAFVDILGYESTDEVLALTSWLAIAAPHERERLERYQRARTRGEAVPSHYEFDALRKDGTEITLQCTVSMTSWHGAPATQSAIIDITERRRAEEALRESEARLAAFIDNSPHSVSIKDVDGRYLLVNPAAERITGCDRDDVAGKRASDFFPREAAERIERTDRNILETGEPIEYEHTLSTSLGLQTLQMVAFPIRAADGKVTAIGRIGTDITERSRMEAALRESETRMTAFFENSPHCFSIKDLEGRYVRVNSAAAAVAGDTSENVLGKCSSDFYPPEDSQIMAHYDGKVVNTGKVVDYEHTLRTSAGARTFYEVGFPVLGSGGEVNGVARISSDVTHLKRAEAALEQSRQRFRDFAEASSDWFWETGPDLRFDYVSERSARLLNLPDADVLSPARLVQVNPDDIATTPERLGEFIDAVESRRPIRDFEFSVRDGWDRPRHIRISAKPIEDDEGVFRGYRGVGSDVTETVESQRQANALREAIEVSSDGVVLFDKDQRVLFSNDEFHRMHPHAPPKDMLVGMTRRETVTRIVRAGWVDHPLACGDPDSYIEMIVTRDLRDDSRVDEQSYTNGRTYLRRYVRLGEGGALVLLTDITERKESERRLEVYQAELRRLASEVSLAEERERRRIAAELHDGAVQNLGFARIKLGSLRGRLADGKAGEELDEIRKVLEQSIREVRSLMSELSPPMLYELGLEPAVEWLAERIRARYGLDCQVELDGEARPVTSEVEISLFQAMRELLMNVVKHAGAKRVAIGVHRLGKELSVYVRDDGVGLDPSRAGMHPSDTGGFGLFSVRERLGLFGGQMRIESDKGTRVTMTVPVEAEHRSGGAPMGK